MKLSGTVCGFCSTLETAPELFYPRKCHTVVAGGSYKSNETAIKYAILGIKTAPNLVQDTVLVCNKEVIKM